MAIHQRTRHSRNKPSLTCHLQAPCIRYGASPTGAVQQGPGDVLAPAGAVPGFMVIRSPWEVK